MLYNERSFQVGSDASLPEKSRALARTSRAQKSTSRAQKSTSRAPKRPRRAPEALGRRLSAESPKTGHPNGIPESL
jgi:hypothetical protein